MHIVVKDEGEKILDSWISQIASINQLGVISKHSGSMIE